MVTTTYAHGSLKVFLIVARSNVNVVTMATVCIYIMLRTAKRDIERLIFKFYFFKSRIHFAYWGTLYYKHNDKHSANYVSRFHSYMIPCLTVTYSTELMAF